MGCQDFEFANQTHRRPSNGSLANLDVINPTHSQIFDSSNNKNISRNIAANLHISAGKATSLFAYLVTFCILLTCCHSVTADLAPNDDAKKDVEPCEVCRLLVKSFEKGLDITARGKHEGGDTSWEERNLKSYTDSEVRLVEIQEQLCEDVTTGKAQCLSLAEDTESELEEWWFSHRNKNVRLHDYLCISKLKRCCPEGKFGPNCQKCPSNCHGHGTCDGSGTRIGSGKCQCDLGYAGEECEKCTEDYFRIATNDNHFTCLSCDLACQGCHGPGPLNCTECRSGYHYQEKEGCVDINECDVGVNANGDTRLCKGNTYCVNTDGYYKCAECHEACASCLGYGANKCLSCARGYSLDKDHFCRTEEEMERQEEKKSDEAWSQRKILLGKVLYNLGNIVSIGVLTFNVTFRNVPIYMVCIYGLIIGIILNAPFFFLTDVLPVPENTRISSE